MWGCQCDRDDNGITVSLTKEIEHVSASDITPWWRPTAPDRCETFHLEGGCSYHSATAKGQRLSSIKKWMRPLWTTRQDVGPRRQSSTDICNKVCLLWLAEDLARGRTAKWSQQRGTRRMLFLTGRSLKVSHSLLANRVKLFH